MRQVTSQGHAHARFRRAVASGNPLLIETAARECPLLSVDDAFAVCLALSGSASRYDKAVVRWLARYARDLSPPPSTTEAQLLLAALWALPGAGADGFEGATAAAAIGAVGTLLAARGLEHAQQALRAWEA
jgi:hypothetical protein